MKVVDHPYLEGVKCREDGAVFVPASRNSKGHWTFGFSTKGYLKTYIHGKRYSVHRLICEAFHGLYPPGKCEVDHIDRGPSNNKPENLRWVSRQENVRNTRVREESLAKYGASYADDNKAYMRAYKRKKYANDPEFREKCKVRSRASYALKKSLNT